MKALLSTYDRTGLSDFASALVDSGFELVSTGGTGSTLEKAGFTVRKVSDLTKSPEMMDGRVKTLHPSIHAGILARRDVKTDLDELTANGIDTIDLVACNLYPFIETVSSGAAKLGDALEKIDVGGPTMVRAAAKNFPGVIVIVDPSDYAWIGERLSSARGSNPLSTISIEERRTLARKAFQHIAYYDTAVSQFLGKSDLLIDPEITLGYVQHAKLRYGENPHQQASVYANPLAMGGVVRAEQLHGTDLSFTNFLDADAAWQTVNEFSESTVTVVKHTNPCGIAIHDDQPTAYRQAFEGDSVSAYGGIVGFNRTVTKATAEAMRGVLYHIVIAPDYEVDALDLLRKRKQLRILKAKATSGPGDDIDVRLVSGGALIQSTDTLNEDAASWQVVTKLTPTPTQLEDLSFAWKAGKHIKSNTIVLAKDKTMVGMGTGQPNRVTSVHLALRIAGEKANNSVMASDAFIPFPDNIELAAEGGVVAIAQPGGSIRDDDVIEAANRLNISMVFTGVRHFKH
ncbi:MAG: bifunctional phosphoribosylaminoimidazolecarboxamide formyltransferase/IMP cyclohydrolase [SAR202 cluster bacterium]|jgi:phosphoribosylaminoimidazolecarboxamide formyltransferase/IMP cyclohydrolase|nr:bifunctional phosphoribosylaminoimidazolecarboxamide formyltransferase/IMP cyclohydrolase [SAR202 cluster bacterium]